MVSAISQTRMRLFCGGVLSSLAAFTFSEQHTMDVYTNFAQDRISLFTFLYTCANFAIHYYLGDLHCFLAVFTLCF